MALRDYGLLIQEIAVTAIEDGGDCKLQVKTPAGGSISTVPLTIQNGLASLDLPQLTTSAWPEQIRLSLQATPSGAGTTTIDVLNSEGTVEFVRLAAMSVSPPVEFTNIPASGIIPDASFDLEWDNTDGSTVRQFDVRARLASHGAFSTTEDDQENLLYDSSALGTVKTTQAQQIPWPTNGESVHLRIIYTRDDGVWVSGGNDENIIDGRYLDVTVTAPTEVAPPDDRDLAFDDALSVGQYDDTDWDNSVAPLRSIFWEPNGTDVVETGTFHGIQGMRVRLDDSRTPSTRMGAAAEIPASQSAEIEFDFVFEEGFSWGTNKFTGKFGFGLGGGSRKAGGNASASDTNTQTGHTSRLIWEGNGDGTANIQSYNYEAATTGWGDKYDTGVTIVEGTVYTARLKQVMNSAAGVADGVLELRIFDKVTGTELGSVIRNNMTWFGQGDPQVDSIVAWTFHGGANVDGDNYSPTHPSYVVFSGVNYEYSENVVTAPIELFNDGIIHNIPILPIANLTEISLLAAPTIAGPHTYKWTRILPTESGVLGTAERLDFILGQANKTFEFKLEIFGPVVSGGGGAPSSDRRTRLLNRQQPGTNMPSRIGYGAAATGGTNYVTVNNVTQLEAALVQGNYVILSSSMNHQTHQMTKKWLLPSDFTLDGRDAPNAIFQPVRQTKKTAVQLGVENVSCENVIIHCVHFAQSANDPEHQITAMQVSNARHIWIDHMTQRRFNKDDGIAIGNSGPGKRTSDITITNCYWDNSCFGAIGIYVYNTEEWQEGRAGRVTIAWNYMNARQRTIVNHGAPNVHFYNNLIYAVQSSKNKVDDKELTGKGLQGAPLVWTDSESNVFTGYELSGGDKQVAEDAISGHANSSIHTDGLNAYDSPYYQAGEVFNPGDAGHVSGRIPYAYDKLTTAQVRTLVGAIDGTFGNVAYDPSGASDITPSEYHSVSIVTAAA